MTTKPRATVARQATMRKPSIAKATSKLIAGDARLVVNLPESLHRAIKLRAVERGMTIRDYVLGLLAADGLQVSDAD